MKPTRRSLALLTEHGRVDDVLLPHEVVRVDVYLAMLDECVCQVAGDDPDPSPLDWHVAREVVALRWKMEREVFNALSVRNEHLTAGSPSEKRRRELAEATEREAILASFVRQIAICLDVHNQLAGAFTVADQYTGPVEVRK